MHVVPPENVPEREEHAPHVAAELRNPLRPRRPPSTMTAPTIHSLLSATMQTGRSLECSQIRNCSSGKLSKAFHTSTVTVTAVSRELCFRKAKKNHIMNVNCHRDFGPPGILVRRGFWSGRTKIPRMRPDKTVRPRDFGPGAEVFV